MRKIAIIVFCFLLTFSLCACQENPSVSPTTPAEDTTLGEQYSVGLQDDGYYTNYEELMPDYTYDLVVQEEDLVNYITTRMQSELGESLTFDDYLELYANDFLSAMELDRKETVELNDIAVVSLVFTNAEGEEMPEYTQEEQRYKVAEDADAIVSSFLTHKVGDEYTVEYTFPEDDQYNPNETVTVAVTILDIYYSDAINSGVVERHLDALNEVLVEVKDAATLKTALYPYVLGYHLQEHIEELVMQLDIEVPAEWTEYEVQRLNCRLEALQMTKEQYMEQMGFAAEDITWTCELIARENMIAMSEYKKAFSPLTEEDLILAYGEENIEYYTRLQGSPYLKLRLLRTLAFDEMAKNTPVIDANGNEIDLSLYFGVDDTQTEQIVLAPATE